MLVLEYIQKKNPTTIHDERTYTRSFALTKIYFFKNIDKYSNFNLLQVGKKLH